MDRVDPEDYSTQLASGLPTALPFYPTTSKFSVSVKGKKCFESL